MKIALYIPTLDGGGAQRVVINLAQGLSDLNCEVTIFLNKSVGNLITSVPDSVNLKVLDTHRTLYAIPKLRKIIKSEGYDVFISFMNYVNIATLIATLFLKRNTAVIITEHINVSKTLNNLDWLKRAIKKYQMKLLYPRADMVIAVSKGVAQDLQCLLDNKIEPQVIYNPIVNHQIKLIQKYGVNSPHQWFQSSNKVIVSVGRLTTQKNFSLLINSFKKVKDDYKYCKLIILGEGPDRNLLESEIKQLNLVNDILLPGFVHNVYDYLYHSDLFVLSSEWEGFGNVIVEAMAFNKPIVSTNCPDGPSEILENGKWGILTENEDEDGLSFAMLKVLNNKLDIDTIDRSYDFDYLNISSKYLKQIDSII